MTSENDDLEQTLLPVRKKKGRQHAYQRESRMGLRPIGQLRTIWPLRCRLRGGRGGGEGGGRKGGEKEGGEGKGGREGGGGREKRLEGWASRWAAEGDYSARRIVGTSSGFSKRLAL